MDGDNNALDGPGSSISSAPITLNYTLTATPGNQVSGGEPGGFSNDTLDLGLLGAAGIALTKEVCDRTVGDCAADAAVGADGWASSASVAFLAEVQWRLTVRNTGVQDLSAVRVHDALAADCDRLVGNLAVGASTSFVCTTSGLISGFVNQAGVDGTGPGGAVVSASADATVLTPDPTPGLNIVTSVVSAGVATDANLAPGVNVAVGEQVSWRHEVSLAPGVTVPMRGLVVTDNAGSPDPADDATAVYVSGDSNGNGLLEVGETWVFTSAARPVVEGQHSMIGTVTGHPITDPAVTARAADPANHFGVRAAVEVSKSTNAVDADSGSGPGALVGDTVTWRYRVSNLGNVPLANLTVTDDQGVAVRCEADQPTIALLAPGQSVTCSATGVAVAGQYRNVGAVSGTPSDTTGQPLTDAAGTAFAAVTDDNPSHYYGVVAGVRLTKLTQNGDHTDAGPVIAVGDDVRWTYRITNTGSTALTGLGVTDDRGVAVTCPAGAALLLPGQSIDCTGTGTATAGAYRNTGTVSGRPALPAAALGANLADPSSWPTDAAQYDPVVRQDGVAVPAATDSEADQYLGLQAGLAVTKRVNGEDADSGYGPTLPVGSTATWLYRVTNTGSTALTGITVTDDRGVAVTCPDGGSTIDLLLPGRSLECAGTGTVTAGHYTNVGTATGTPALPTDGSALNDPGSWPSGVSSYEPATSTQPSGQTVAFEPVSAQNPANHFGSSAALSVVKATNGDDANAAPGRQVIVGDTVTWTYRVTNTGNTALTDITVTDDRVAASEISCPSGSNAIALLVPDQAVECSASGPAVAGQYVNLGTASGTVALPKQPVSGQWPTDPADYVAATAPGGAPLARVNDTDPSHYVGVATGLGVVKQVCVKAGCDPTDASAWGDSVTVANGEPVSFRVTVTNTGTSRLAPVTVDDPLVPACSTTVDALEPGASHTVTCSTTLTGPMTNTASATGRPVDSAGNPLRHIDGDPVVSATASDTAAVVLAPTSPTTGPTTTPTTGPTVSPTTSPTTGPTTSPTISPTSPTTSPTAGQTTKPTVRPTGTSTGSASSSVTPTAKPRGPLPRTGATVLPMLALSGSLVLLGFVLVARRRRLGRHQS